MVKNVRSFKALRVKQEKYSALLTVVIEKRLPHNCERKLMQLSPPTHFQCSWTSFFKTSRGTEAVEGRSSEVALKTASGGFTRQKKPLLALTTISRNNKATCSAILKTNPLLGVKKI